MDKNTLNIDTKSQLAKLLATENITVQQNNVKTASFDVVNRVLTLPIFKTNSKDVTDMLVAHECAHALFTPTNGWKKIADDNELRAYVNVLEDCRIDAKIQKKYPGVVENYLNGFEILNRRNFFGLKDKDYDTDLMLIDKINVFYKSSKKLLFNFSNADKLWLKKVDELKTFNDVIKLAKQLLDWQKKEVKKLKKLPDFDNHILVENYNLKNKENDSKDSKDIEGDGNKDDNSDSDSKDKQDGEEGKTESESKQDKPAVGDKTAKDKETNSGSGEVGAGGDMQLTSITNNHFEGHKEKLLDTSTSYLYRSIPEPILNKVIYSNDNFIKDMKQSFIDDKITAKEYLPYLKKEYKKFVNESKKTIMYLVKEFEMKKAATAYKRASTNKTGTIDPLKLHSYKFNEDIFKRLTVLPDAKNHGMMMLLDWSGSMSDTIFKTVQQTIQLVSFCQKTNIPFELYFFSSEMDKDEDRSYKRSYGFKYKHGDMSIDKITLVNVASHKLKKQKLEESLMYLYHLAMYYDHRYSWRTNWDGDHRPDSVGIPSKYYLGSTPLNEALIIMLKLIPLFKEKYKIEKMNLITLTDGGGNYGSTDTMKYNEETKQLVGTYPDNHGDDVLIYKKKYHKVKDENYGYRTTGFTGTLLNMLRDYHNITTIGFYLIKRIRRWETDMYFRPYNPNLTWDEKDKLYNKNRKLFNKDKVCTVPQKGYDDYYIVNAKDMKVQNVDLEGINDTMKPGKIKNLFSKSMKGRITSRVLLNKFIEKVA